MTPLIVLPAAGTSSRMRGRDKLLQEVDGEPLLRRQARAAVATGCPVVVTLRVADATRRDTLEGLAVGIEDVPEADEGMSASLRHAAALLAEGQPLGILLPDVPGIGADDIRVVLERFQEFDGSRPTRAGQRGSRRPGTPLFLPHEIARGFSDLEADDGGRRVLDGIEIEWVRFPDDRAVRDLDTPEDWAAWRRDRRS